jgi:HD-like signal output (HDOD) protein
VACLGLNALQALTLTFGAFQAFSEVARCPGFDRERHQAHAYLTGYIAGAMARSNREREELFTLGVLHDIGKLALASHLPSRYGPVLRAAVDASRPVHEMEREAGLPSHAAVGGALLSLWGLPPAVVEAVRLHHDRDRLASAAWGDVAAVHVADALAHEQPGGGAEDGGTGPELDEGLLEALGVADRLAEWREAARVAGTVAHSGSRRGSGTPAVSGAGRPGARPA